MHVIDPDFFNINFTQSTLNQARDNIFSIGKRYFIGFYPMYIYLIHIINLSLNLSRQILDFLNFFKIFDFKPPKSLSKEVW